MAVTALATPYWAFMIDAEDYARDLAGRARKGQAYFWQLMNERPELAKRVHQTDEDPYHDDERIPAFLAWVRENW